MFQITVMVSASSSGNGIVTWPVWAMLLPSVMPVASIRLKKWEVRVRTWDETTKDRVEVAALAESLPVVWSALGDDSCWLILPES